MASCMMAPSHYLKQCGLIIKLINKVLWHLSQWIIMKDLKIPIRKMRLKFICWDNFIPSPEIIHLYSSDNSFVCVMVVSWQLLSQSLIPLASVYSRGTRYPPIVFCDHNTGGQCPKNLKRQTCCMRSQPHERLWPPLLKLNLEMVGKLVSASVAVAKSSIPVFNSISNSNSRDFNSNSIFNSTNFNIRGIRVTKDWYFRQCFNIILNSTPMIFHSLCIKCEFTIFDLQLNFLVRFDERKIFESCFLMQNPWHAT